jgi:N-methylhydantoinase A
MDIRPIGAGGGSIARVDAGGLLVVGPDSAGANPGPMCYGLGGTEPTVTDAAVVDGVIDPDYFLGGEIKLDAELARKGVGELAAKLGITLHEAAGGILTIARNGMTTATKEILIGQGYDPRDFALMSYGGAGGIFAAGLARDLSMSRVIIPPNPGVFSAWGMLTMDIAHTFAHTYVRPMARADLAELAGIYRDMESRARALLAEERVPDDAVEFLRTLDMCYEGQGHYVEVPVPAMHLDEDAKPAIVEAFHQLHEARYGHRMSAPPKIVNVRMKATGRLKKVPLKRSCASAGVSTGALKGTRDVFMDGKLRQCGIYDRANLLSGNVIPGPAIVEEPHHITVVLPGQKVGVDSLENLVIEA